MLVWCIHSCCVQPLQLQMCICCAVLCRDNTLPSLPPNGLQEKVYSPQQMSGLESLMVPPVQALWDLCTGQHSCSIVLGARLSAGLEASAAAAAGSSQQARGGGGGGQQCASAGQQLEQLLKQQPAASSRQYMLCVTGGNRRKVGFRRHGWVVQVLSCPGGYEVR